MPTRGVLYVVWGDNPKYEAFLDRSIASVEKHCPGLPHAVVYCDREAGLSNKPQHINIYSRDDADNGSPPKFDTTLFLDVDTVVLGDLTYGFDMAERHGLACCVGECPWLRRFDRRLGDMVEYNTGVIFFSQKARPVLEKWAELDPHYTGKRDGSVVDVGQGPIPLECDDQLSFGKAVYETGFNPYVLPLNWNYRPGWHTRVFTPLKIWHSIHPVPDKLEEMSGQAERGERPVTFIVPINAVPANPKLYGVG